MPNPTSDISSLMPLYIAYVGSSLVKKTSVLSSVMLDLSAAKAAKGDTIDSLFSQEMTVTDVTPSEAPPTYQQPTFKRSRLKLDNWKNVKFKYNADDISGNGVQNTFVRESIYAATVTMIDYVTNNVADAMRITPNILAKTSTPINSYSELVELNKLITSNAPSSLRSVLFGRKTEAALFNEASMIGTIYSPQHSAIQDGVFAQTLGYTLIPYERNVKSSTTPATNEISGDITFLMPVNFNANQEYEIMVTVDAGNDTKKFYPGNVIIDQSQPSIDNKASFVIHDVATVSGTSATITISVSSDFHSCAGGAFTCKMLDIKDDAFAYQKFGIGLASRPSAVVGLTSNSMHFDDRVNNFAYGITSLEGYYTQLLSLDFLYGTKIIIDNYVARAVQISSSNGGYVA